jgi:glycosyltransferase involved in cell wall biosynthesis
MRVRIEPEQRQMLAADLKSEDPFLVSVVTPVYNAERYVRRAVESAVSLCEVGEVILVEDASPDGALRVCEALSNEYEKVRLVRHPDEKNHGAGASRNLGILHSRFPYIAFLDADDFYLPHRFHRDKEILTADSSIEGVYHAMGIEYEDEIARTIFLSTIGKEQEVIALSASVTPEELIFVWLCVHPTVKGCFATNSITVRKSVFEKAGFFNERLRLQQDTDLFIRLSAVCRLASGDLENPVSIRGVHQHQRTTNVELQKRCQTERLRFEKRWFAENIRDKRILNAFARTYWYHMVWTTSGAAALYPTIRLSMTTGLRESLKPYGLLDEGLSRVFGNGTIARHALSAKRRLCQKIFDRFYEEFPSY